MTCELCKFNNPKGAATAVVIKGGNLLMLRRSEEPFLGKWDFPGGYMSAGELPEETLRRELREELGVTPRALDFIGWFPGTALWRGASFAVLSHAYLADIPDDFILNQKENNAYRWQSLFSLDPAAIAFDSNQAIARLLKEKFTIDYAALAGLIRQLDSSAHISEMNLYRSILNGSMSKKVVDGRLVGVGWIFPRRTFLRKQAVIEDVVVDESERGKGYGEEIVRDLLRWARENNVEVIELTSGSHRVAANNLYQKLGFKLHPTNHYLLVFSRAQKDLLLPDSAPPS